MARLRIDSPEGTREVALSGRVTIGRHPNNTHQVLDRTIAREHCVLEERDGRYVLRDLGSPGGLLLNGQRLATEALLRHLDRVNLGATTLTFLDDAAGGVHPEPWTLQVAADPYSHEVRVCFSPEDRWVALLAPGGRLEVYDCASRERVYAEAHLSWSQPAPYGGRPSLLPNPFQWAPPGFLLIFELFQGQHRVRCLEFPTANLVGERSLPLVTRTALTKRYQRYEYREGAHRLAYVTGDGTRLVVHDATHPRPDDTPIPSYFLRLPSLACEDEVTLASPQDALRGTPLGRYHAERTSLWGSPDGWPLVAQYRFRDPDEIPVGSARVHYPDRATPVLLPGSGRDGYGRCLWLSRTQCALFGSQNFARLDLQAPTLEPHFTEAEPPSLRVENPVQCLDVHPDGDRALVRSLRGESPAVLEVHFDPWVVRTLAHPRAGRYDRKVSGARLAFVHNAWELFEGQSGDVLARLPCPAWVVASVLDFGTSPRGTYLYLRDGAGVRGEDTQRLVITTRASLDRG